MLQPKQEGIDVHGATKPRAGMLDTRTYQELEPLRLPSILRDRITRAQRRAAAEKDGISIFSSNIPNESVAVRDKDFVRQTSRVNDDASGVMGQNVSQPNRESQELGTNDESGPVMLTSKEKLHLPDVIISHKMREFEAKMNLNALFVDPLENNLHHLSIDDKEKVMLRMQEKIHAITAQIDAHFVQIKEELDSNGIFDSSANYQRAQTLCLVELQKRCRLEKLRDEAMREVLDENGGGSHAATSLMEGKLDDLLASKNRSHGEESDRSINLAFIHLQKNTKSFELKRRPAAPRRDLSPLKHKLQQSRSSNQLTHDNIPSVITNARAEPIADTSLTTSPLNAATPTEDWTTRHPHIVQVLQHFAAGGSINAQSTSSNDTLESFSSRETCSERGNPDSTGQSNSTPADDWLGRSNCYHIIGDRAFQTLQQRWARWRWDSTKHFHPHTNNPLQSVEIVISDDLCRRVLQQRATASARLRDEQEQQRRATVEESNSEKRKRVQSQYHQLQASIHTRRQERERHLESTSNRVSTANPRLYGARMPLKEKVAEARRIMTADNGISARNNSIIDAPESFDPSSPAEEPLDSATGNNSAPLSATVVLPARVSLVTSASAPLLTNRDSMPVPMIESRRALRERKLAIISRQLSRRSRVRGDSLIGGRLSMDLNTLGHFSNARMEERRDSAQTWAWHHPHSKAHPHALRLISEGGEFANELDDGQQDSDADASECRDGMGETIREDDEERNGDECCDGDNSDDGRDSVDDSRSIRSSLSSGHVMDSARSSFSVMSKKVGYTRDDTSRNGRLSKRKQQKSPSHSSSRGRRSPSPSKRRIAKVHGPQGSRLMSRPSNSSNLSGSSGGMFAGLHFTANAQVMQHRLEELWCALEFPFSTKLIMLEKYASLGDPDALLRALIHWEAVADTVLLREKLIHIVEEFQELKDLKASSRLTPAEWSYLLMQQIEIPPNAINLSSKDLVRWTQAHMDAVTHMCEKMAQNLKVNTGDELTFQGRRYPPRV